MLHTHLALADTRFICITSCITVNVIFFVFIVNNSNSELVKILAICYYYYYTQVSAMLDWIPVIVGAWSLGAPGSVDSLQHHFASGLGSETTLAHAAFGSRLNSEATLAHVTDMLRLVCYSVLSALAQPSLVIALALHWHSCYGLYIGRCSCIPSTFTFTRWAENTMLDEHLLPCSIVERE